MPMANELKEQRCDLMECTSLTLNVQFCDDKYVVFLSQKSDCGSHNALQFEITKERKFGAVVAEYQGNHIFEGMTKGNGSVAPSELFTHNSEITARLELQSAWGVECGGSSTITICVWVCTYENPKLTQRMIANQRMKEMSVRVSDQIQIAS